MKAKAKLVTFLLALLLPSSGVAHHVVSEHGIATVEPMTSIETTFEYGSFGFGAQTGNWQEFSLRGEFAVHDRLSLSVRMPWAHIDFDDGRRVVGVGDIEASALVELYASEHGGFVASAGIGTAAPTGEVLDGLGAGHFELAPFIVASTNPLGWLVLDALVVDKIGLGSVEKDLGVHGGIVSPHSDHELTSRLGASIVVDALYVRTALEHDLVYAGRDSTEARAEVGWAEPGAWRISVGTSLPVAGDERSRWRTSIAFANQF